MSDDLDHDDVDDVDDDPWLTVAEIAAELRVNPATVRLWISKGTLPAKRAGQRKLLIRRSHLDRMLEMIRREQHPVGPRPQRGSHRRYRDRPPVLQSMRQLSTADIHGHRVSSAEMEELVEQLQRADALWDAAQGASDNPPPDPGFPHRVRALAIASERRGRALGVAASVRDSLGGRRPASRTSSSRTSCGPAPTDPARRSYGRSSIGRSSGWALPPKVGSCTQSRSHTATLARSCTRSPTCFSARPPKRADRTMRQAEPRPADRSAIRALLRSDLRTGIECRPPRRHWARSGPRHSLWQLTTRPPRGRSGS